MFIIHPSGLCTAIVEHVLDSCRMARGASPQSVFSLVRPHAVPVQDVVAVPPRPRLPFVGIAHLVCAGRTARSVHCRWVKGRGTESSGWLPGSCWRVSSPHGGRRAAGAVPATVAATILVARTAAVWAFSQLAMDAIRGSSAVAVVPVAEGARSASVCDESYITGVVHLMSAPPWPLYPPHAA